MLSNLLKTEPDVTFTVARLILGIVFFAHGAQKMLGWFGGYGFNGTMGFFMQKMGIPAPLAFLAICAEFFGSLGLIFGLLTRVAALGIATTMTVAIFMVHLQNGLFYREIGWRSGRQVVQGSKPAASARSREEKRVRGAGGRVSSEGHEGTQYSRSPG